MQGSEGLLVPAPGADGELARIYMVPRTAVAALPLLVLDVPLPLR